MVLTDRGSEFLDPLKKDIDTADEIQSMMNHINSYTRKKWNGQAPIDLFKQIYCEEVKYFSA